MWKAVVARTGQMGPDGRATTELKALLVATAGTLLGLVLQVVAVSTNSWLLLELPSGGVARNKSGQASVVVDASIGLWKICRVFRPVLKDGTVSSDERECTLHSLLGMMMMMSLLLLLPSLLIMMMMMMVMVLLLPQIMMVVVMVVIIISSQE